MNISKRALLVVAAFALMPLAASGVNAATTTVPDRGATAMSTGFDRAIDLYLQQQISSGRLTSKDAMVAREQMQMQFLSLTQSERDNVAAAARDLSSPEIVAAAISALNAASVSAARAALDELQPKTDSNVRAQGLAPKLGGDGDLVYLSLVGPCRIYDSRFGPGMLPAGFATQVYGLSILNGYNFAVDQGGTGVTGSGNCQPMAFIGVRPVAIVAAVTVLNTSTPGALQVWNGGTVLTVGAALAWNSGDRLSNTTVIPMDRSIAAFPGSGPKRDFGMFNNSPGPIDIVVDALGYFIVNQATALDCQRILDTDFSLAAGTSVLRTAPACPAGYTPMMGMPATNIFGVYTGTILENQCRINNATGATVNFLRCDAFCCRVPGR